MDAVDVNVVELVDVELVVVKGSVCQPKAPGEFCVP